MIEGGYSPIENTYQAAVDVEVDRVCVRKSSMQREWEMCFIEHTATGHRRGSIRSVVVVNSGEKKVK